jgi:hypothetical protein
MPTEPLHFESTQPMDADGEPRAGAAAWPVAAAEPAFDASSGHSTELDSLSPSLLQDLMRFEDRGEQRELLEVLAACVRHTQSLAIRLAVPRTTGGHHELTLTVFPIDRLVHCPMPIDDFLQSDLTRLAVLVVQPASLRAPGDAQPARVGSLQCYTPLAPLLWAVALNGSRRELLPELAGLAAYRVAPGLSLGSLPLPAALAGCITRLRRQTCNLRDIAEWQGMGRESAARLLNALYLQSGLIVSRTHPAATNEGWNGYR